MAMNADNASATLVKQPKPGKKYFSLVEANRSLSYVARVVDDLSACYGRVVDLRRRMERPTPQVNREQVETQYEAAMDQLAVYVDELQLVGVELKDFEKGLLDYPAWHEGREICLCWQRGEKNVDAWHETEAGFAGRQDVALLKVN